MGKGTVVSNLTSGQYSVQINYHRETFEARIAAIDENIAILTERIIDLTISTEEYNIAVLQRTALQKQKSELEKNFPDDKTITAWCADLSEELTGVVATIEIPGESVQIQIAPGHADSAAYTSSKDGQLVPTTIQGACQVFYNLAMLPGWQKWMPTFRYGVITELNIEDDTCSVTVDAATSSQQNLNINQTETLTSVPVTYMTCNAMAFSVGDSVLIQFTGQSWDAPKVIGFKDNPKPCITAVYLRPTIDGHSLDHGGQRFFLRYFNKLGVEVDTTVLDLMPGTDTKRKGFVGPYNLSNWDRTTDIKICLKKDKIYSDNYINTMFDYFQEKPEGTNALWALYKKRVVNTERTLKCFPIGSDTEIERLDAQFSTYSYELEVAAENAYTEYPSWTTGILTDFSVKRKKLLSNVVRLNEIYKTLTPQQFLSSMSVESEIYNYTTGEMDIDAQVFTGDLDFELKGSAIGYMQEETTSYIDAYTPLDSTPLSIVSGTNSFPSIHLFHIAFDAYDLLEHYFQPTIWPIDTGLPRSTFNGKCSAYTQDGESLCEWGANPNYSMPVVNQDLDSFELPTYLCLVTDEFKVSAALYVSKTNTMSFGGVPWQVTCSEDAESWEPGDCEHGEILEENFRTWDDVNQTWTAQIVDLPLEYF